MSECTTCNKSFKYNHLLIKHLNRRYPCVDKTLKQTEYLYVIHTREFIKQNRPLYKVGRSNQPIGTDGITKRIEQYPKGSLQKALFPVENYVAAEAHMKKQLDHCKDLKLRTECGFEYFEGPLKTLLTVILDTVELFTTNPIVTDLVPPLQIEPLDTLQCKYCYGTFSRSDHLKNHIITCKEKDDVVRILEMQLDIQYKKTKINECRFCNHIFSYKTALTRHIKTCKEKYKYQEKLEEEIKKTQVAKK